jgi:hypothetical protein
MADRYVQRETLFVRAMLLCCAIVLAHFVHVGWIGFSHNPPPPGSVLPEPNFRVAMPFLYALLIRIVGPNDGVLLITITDFISALIGLNLLYALTVSGLKEPPARSTSRVLTVALFLAFLQFPLAFVVPWQRPETLPSMLYLAFSLFCLQRSTRGLAWTIALLVAAAIQTFVRADVAIVFGGALVAMSFLGTTLAPFGSRTVNVVRGLIIVAMSGIFQYYMQFVKYRNFPYQKGSPVADNFTPHMLGLFFAAALVFVFATFFFFMQRRRLTAVEALIVAGSILYLPFYIVLGVIGEVRIYVPFLCCLCVVAARVSASYLMERDVMEETVSP